MTPQITHRDNFIWLLAALVFLLFSGAVFDQIGSQHGERLVNAALLITVILAIWSMEKNQGRWLNRKIGISIAFFITMVTDSVIESNVLANAQLVMCFLFFALTLHLAPFTLHISQPRSIQNSLRQPPCITSSDIIGI